MPRLFLRVLSEAQPLEEGEGYALGVEWLIKEADGTVRGAGVTDYRGLADIADPNVTWLADPDNTVVFVPSQFVLMVSCEVPGRSIAHIRRALPFAAEEYVASDIESMHIAHAPIKPGSAVLCNILPREVMQNWLACFASLGVTPGCFVVDAQALPAGGGSVSVLFEGDTCLVADADQAATVDRGNLAFALNSLSAAHIYCINGSLTDIERSQLEGGPQIEDVQVSEHGVLDFLAEQYGFRTFINLLQGEYTPSRPVNAGAARWRGVIALAAVWVLVAFLGLVVQGWWASREADRLVGESFAFYERVFPGDSQPATVEQLRRRMSAKLGTNAGGSETSAFIGLAANFANVADPAHLLQGLSYADQRQELTVEILLAGYDDLETIKSRLAQVGVAVDVASAEEEGDRVRSRMRVRYTE